MNGAQLQEYICKGGIIRGMRKVYYKKPFANARYPTKAEVDDYNLRVTAHVRAMIGISSKMAPVRSKRCTASLALWTQPLWSTDIWTAKYPKEAASCKAKPSGHCNFAPNATDQKLTFRGVGNSQCSPGMPSEGLGSTNANIPWALKYSRIICTFLPDAHAGPIFRKYVHPNFYYSGSNKTVQVRVKGEGPLFSDPNYLPKFLLK